jgi:hypothetical protein
MLCAQSAKHEAAAAQLADARLLLHFRAGRMTEPQVSGTGKHQAMPQTRAVPQLARVTISTVMDSEDLKERSCQSNVVRVPPCEHRVRSGS